MRFMALQNEITDHKTHCWFTSAENFAHQCIWMILNSKDINYENDQIILANTSSLSSMVSKILN